MEGIVVLLKLLKRAKGLSIENPHEASRAFYTEIEESSFITQTASNHRLNFIPSERECLQCKLQGAEPIISLRYVK